MIKRILCICITLFSVMSFCCFGHATSYAVFEYIDDETEYYEFLKEAEIPDHVVTYDEDWHAIGCFGYFWVPYDDYGHYYYKLEDGSSCDFELSVSKHDGGYPYPIPSNEIISPRQDLRHNTNNSEDKYYYSRVGALYYRYTPEGKLTSIRWSEKNSEYETMYRISFSDEEYPKGELFSRLLNLETAESAGRELISIICEKSSFPWLWIALPVGVAVIGGAAVILLRRRKKAVAANSENGTLAEE